MIVILTSHDPCIDNILLHQIIHILPILLAQVQDNNDWCNISITEYTWYIPWQKEPTYIRSEACVWINLRIVHHTPTLLIFHYNRCVWTVSCYMHKVPMSILCKKCTHCHYNCKPTLTWMKKNLWHITGHNYHHTGLNHDPVNFYITCNV